MKTNKLSYTASKNYVENGVTYRIDVKKEYKLTVEFHNGARYCYYGKTKKEALAAFKKSFGNFKGFVKKEWTIEQD